MIGPRVARHATLVGCLGLFCLSGCAQWGWNNAGRSDFGKRTEDEASFVPAHLAKTHPMSKPKKDATKPATVAATKSEATPTATTPPVSTPAPTTPPAAGAATAVANKITPEEEALIADTLARLRTLPDMKSEDVDAIAREFRNPNNPTARLLLPQMNASAKLRQEQAVKAKTASIAATLPAIVDKSDKPQTQPSPVAKAVHLEVEPPAKAVEEKVAEEEEEPEEEVKPAPVRRPLMDRIRKNREQPSSPSAPSIFGGKVSANLAPRLDKNVVAVSHVTHKPAEEVEAEEAKAELAWDEQLSGTIAAVERSLRDDQLSESEAARLAQALRLLNLVAGKKEANISAGAHEEAAEIDFWRGEAHGLSVLLDRDGTPVKSKRATLALRSFREAVDHLASQAALDVKNIAFCSSVTIWGNYEAFPRYEFKPNQEVLLYFEVENFTSEESKQGFATEFASNCEIFDSAGKRVAEHQFPLAQETCQNRRRDYFIRYHLHIPKTLTAGDYTLQLTVEDQKGHKFGQGSVKFKVT